MVWLDYVGVEHCLECFLNFLAHVKRYVAIVLLHRPNVRIDVQCDTFSFELAFERVRTDWQR